MANLKCDEVYRGLWHIQKYLYLGKRCCPGVYHTTSHYSNMKHDAILSCQTLTLTWKCTVDASNCGQYLYPIFREQSYEECASASIALCPTAQHPTNPEWATLWNLFRNNPLYICSRTSQTFKPTYPILSQCRSYHLQAKLAGIQALIQLHRSTYF